MVPQNLSVDESVSVPSAAGRPPSLGFTLRNADLKLYHRVRSTFGWVKHEWKARTGLPLGRRLDLWRRGFFAESGPIYDLPRSGHGDYVTDYQRFLACNLINAWDDFYKHKMVLRSFLLAMGFRQAKTVALILDRRIQIHPYAGQGQYVEPDALLDLLRGDGSEKQYIVKPEDGLCGEDIFLLTSRDGEFFRQRGREVERFDLATFFAGQKRRQKSPILSGTLIEERLTQAPFWSELFPGSANTIRALTLWIPGEAAPFIAHAAQRIGTADTVPTDNWSRGGISVLIDPATGRLGVGRMHPQKGRRREVSFEHHPDTGAQLTGAVLPDWAGISDTVLRAAGSLPFNPMGGWDVLVAADGSPVILEANGNSGLDLLQVHGGLLAEPRTRRFYQAFDVS